MRYKKKPIVIEAIQYNGTQESRLEISRFARHWFDIDCIGITTPNGYVTIDKNDWIIKGSDSDFYPCKPDVFEKTYEKVN